MAASVPGHKRRTGQILFAVMLALCALLTFGVTADDEAALRGFDEAADGWQADPEFRAVAMDYCVRGARALHTRPLLLSADNVMMGLRSLPFLPKRFAVNPTSRAHYDNFGRGPLSAYLHLCGEQSVRDFAGVLESLGKQTTRTPDDLRKFLDAFQMDYPVCKDSGALDSVARLLDDADAARPLAVRDDVGPLLAPHIAALARELQIPDDVARMTPAQQLAVLQRLDDFVRRRDPELWRTKQLNDFCGGVWEIGRAHV